MRLSEFEIESIKSLANRHFGNDVQIFLFGSRINANLRGGDIDLFVRDSTGKTLKIRNKINFITDLILQIGDQRIDVVLDNKEARNSVFFKTIERTAIRIC